MSDETLSSTEDPRVWTELGLVKRVEVPEVKRGRRSVRQKGSVRRRETLNASDATEV